MVSSREVIDLAVCVLDAVEDPDVPASQMFDAVVQASQSAGAPGDSRAVPPRGQQAAVHYDLLAAEVQPLVAALERHLQRVRTWRSAQEDVHDSGEADGDPGLTARETEALVLLSRGFTAKATARRMGCATSTANKHWATCTASSAWVTGWVRFSRRSVGASWLPTSTTPRRGARRPIGPIGYAGTTRARAFSA